jgi:hypothetical protein
MTITSTGLQVSYNRQTILNDVTETSIQHQAFDNTLSRRPIMNISSKISVPALSALLTSSYLHAAGGMMARTEATPTSLLLFYVKDGTVVTTATHEPSLFLLCIKDNSKIITGSLFLLCVKDNSEIMAPSLLLFDIKVVSAIMAATHANSTLQLIDVSIRWVPSAQTLYQSQRILLLHCVLREHSQLPTFLLDKLCRCGLIVDFIPTNSLLPPVLNGSAKVISCCFASMNAQQLQ